MRKRHFTEHYICIINKYDRYGKLYQYKLPVIFIPM